MFGSERGKICPSNEGDSSPEGQVSLKPSNDAEAIVQGDVEKATANNDTKANLKVPDVNGNRVSCWRKCCTTVGFVILEVAVFVSLVLLHVSLADLEEHYDWVARARIFDNKEIIFWIGMSSMILARLSSSLKWCSSNKVERKLLEEADKREKAHEETMKANDLILKRVAMLERLLAPNEIAGCGGVGGDGTSCAAPTLPNGNGAVDGMQQYHGPSIQAREEAAGLVSSTEPIMMKSGFVNMGMTYFTSSNMVRAMKKVAAQDTVMTIGDNSSTAAATASLIPSAESTDTTLVREWSINDVVKWLSVISLDLYSDSFRDGAVDGNFLCRLTDDDLRAALGVEHRLHRKKILCCIEELMYPPETATGSNQLLPSSPVPLGSPLPSNAQYMYMYTGQAHEAMIHADTSRSLAFSDHLNIPLDETEPRQSSRGNDHGGMVPPTFDEPSNQQLCNQRYSQLQETMVLPVPTKLLLRLSRAKI
jgi:hypothetical protein